MNPPSLLGEGAERDGRDHTKTKNCDYSGKGNTMSKNFEQRLYEGGHWKKGNECLNLCDINKPPDFYEGTEKEWIDELTTYIFLYPKEWEILYQQYPASGGNEHPLQFCRNEEGYLRKIGVNETYLKIFGRMMTLPYDELNHIGRLLSEQGEELYWSFLEYCSMDESGKELWRERMETDIRKYLDGIEVSVSVEDTLDDSRFSVNEIYFDLLNNYYIIL